MNILVIGNGGREHAIVWKLKQSKNADKIFCTAGNAGIDEITEPVLIKPNLKKLLLQFVEENNIDFTVIGPEVPLANGIVDEFIKAGNKIFGPTKNAARLENSKVFAKEFMKKHGIPTAQFEKFNINDKERALAYIENHKYPVVIKADGLAAGKGVIICDNVHTARETIMEIFDGGLFGKSGENIVIEEFLTGNEVSVFAICDGENYIVLPSSQDHKRILDGEIGKNTGGMGSFAPANKVVNDEIINKVKTRIIEPVLKHMKEDGNEFKGCLYCGLMINENGDPFVIEFNTRFGDPETQVVLPLIKSDFLEMLMMSAEGNIKNYNLEMSNEFYCCVVLASNGYPDKYETGKVISGLDKITDNCIIFHAGTKSENGKIVSNGGRVLNVVGKGKSLDEAIKIAYKNADIIDFENKYFRNDIGQKGL